MTTVVALSSADFAKSHKIRVPTRFQIALIQDIFLTIFNIADEVVLISDSFLRLFFSD